MILEFDYWIWQRISRKLGKYSYSLLHTVYMDEWTVEFHLTSALLKNRSQPRHALCQVGLPRRWFNVLCQTGLITAMLKISMQSERPLVLG